MGRPWAFYDYDTDRRVDMGHMPIGLAQHVENQKANKAANQKALDEQLQVKSGNTKENLVSTSNPGNDKQLDGSGKSTPGAQDGAALQQATSPSGKDAADTGSKSLSGQINSSDDKDIAFAAHGKKRVPLSNPEIQKHLDALRKATVAGDDVARNTARKEAIEAAKNAGQHNNAFRAALKVFGRLSSVAFIGLGELLFPTPLGASESIWLKNRSTPIEFYTPAPQN